MYALAASMSEMSMGESLGDNKPPTDPELKRMEERKQRSKIKRLTERGVNEYWYGDEVIYARNQKNADRKAKNKGLIK